MQPSWVWYNYYIIKLYILAIHNARNLEFLPSVHAQRVKQLVLFVI